MKKLISIMITVFTFAVAQGQEKSDSKVVETTFQVKGVCDMCKNRIENAAMRTKGVKLAEWNKESQELKVLYNQSKATEEDIHKSVAEHGHETSMIPADSSAYKKLPECCRYQDGAKCAH